MLYFKNRRKREFRHFRVNDNIIQKLINEILNPRTLRKMFDYIINIGAYRNQVLTCYSYLQLNLFL